MKKLTALSLSVASFLTLVPSAFAGLTTTINPCPSVSGAAGTTSFFGLCGLSLSNGNVVGNLINIAFIAATLIALFFLIFGGIKWILSGGDKTKVEAARGTIVAALVGLVIVFLSYFLVRFIFGLFNLTFGTFNLNFTNIFQ